jgi:hypothetical protein
MRAIYGSMRSTGSRLALAGALAGLVAGCGPSAAVDPLGASLAPAQASPCHARFSFEDGSLANWSAPSYAGGFRSMQIDGVHSFCGSKALHVRMELGGPASKLVVIQYFFDQLQALNGATRTLHIYFEQAPPPQVRLQAVFVGQDLNWKSPSPATQSGFGAGWTVLSGSITAPQVAGFLMQFDTTGPAHWIGDAWIDEIDW